MGKPVASTILEMLIKALIIVGAAFLAFVSTIFDLAKKSKWDSGRSGIGAGH